MTERTTSRLWCVEGFDLFKLFVNLFEAFAFDAGVENRLEGGPELPVANCVDEPANLSVPVVHPFEKAPQSVSCLLIEEGKCSGR